MIGMQGHIESKSMLGFGCIAAALCHLAMMFGSGSFTAGIIGCFVQLYYFYVIKQYPKVDIKMIVGACG